MPLAILYVCICAGLLAAPRREHFSQYQSVIANLAEPVDAAVDADGRIFVLEREACRVRAFDVQGNELRGFGERGSADGELLRPEGLALGERGEVYVADTGNHRVVVFDREGKLVRSFGGRGRALGQLENPLGLCIAKGACYVADAGNDRVQTFDLAGAPIRAYGREYGLDPSRFNRPSDVAVDGSGHLFVCDSRSFRVVKLHADGRWITSFGDAGDPNHLLARPRGLDYQGSRIFVTDSENHRIQAFDTFGKRLFAFGTRSYGVGEGEGRLYAPTSAAVHPEGDFAVVCEPLEDRVQIFVGEQESADFADGQDLDSHNPDDHRLDAHRLDIGELPHYGGVGGSAGDLMVLADLELQAIVVFDTSQVDPAPIAKLGTLGPRLGELREPCCPAVDPLKGRILVGDPGNCRLQVFALQGRTEGDLSFNPLLGELVKAIDFCALAQDGRGGAAWPIEPTAICCDSSGNIFVLDQRNAAVFVLDAKLRALRSFGEYGSGAGELRGPTDLALNPAGKICYVVDADNQRLQVFDVDGNALGKWGMDGAGGREPFPRPRGVGVDALGRVYVADEASDSIFVFDSAGKPLAEWGETGSGPAQFRRPSDVLPGPAPGGYVYVIDAGNRRGQVLTSEGKFVVAF